jgi:HNH endonuclease
VDKYPCATSTLVLYCIYMKKPEQIQEEIDNINKARKEMGHPDIYTYEDYLSNIPLNNKIRRQVMERDKFNCQYCGKGYPEVKLGIDHKIPRSKKGNNELTNLITTCIPCNSHKGNKTYEEFIIILNNEK